MYVIERVRRCVEAESTFQLLRVNFYIRQTEIWGGRSCGDSERNKNSNENSAHCAILRKLRKRPNKAACCGVRAEEGRRLKRRCSLLRNYAGSSKLSGIRIAANGMCF